MHWLDTLRTEYTVGNISKSRHKDKKGLRSHARQIIESKNDEIRSVVEQKATSEDIDRCIQDVKNNILHIVTQAHWLLSQYNPQRVDLLQAQPIHDIIDSFLIRVRLTANKPLTRGGISKVTQRFFNKNTTPTK